MDFGGSEIYFRFVDDVELEEEEASDMLDDAGVVCDGECDCILERIDDGRPLLRWLIGAVSDALRRSFAIII